LDQLELDIKIKVRKVSAATGAGISEAFQELFNDSEEQEFKSNVDKNHDVKPNYLQTFRERMLERVLYMFIGLQIMD